MKKIIGILVILVVIIAVGGFIFSLSAGKLIKQGVVQFGPEIAQVKIELEDANLSLLSGSGGLDGLKVYNPEGYQAEHAFYAESLSMDLQPMSVMSDKIVIDEILIIGPDIQFEKKDDTSNLNQIMENVQSFVGPAEETETTAEAKKIEIKRFVLQDATVGVSLGSDPVNITIPTIELTDLGSGEEGITGGEVTRVLLGEVTKQILAAIARDPKLILEGGGALLKGLGDSGSDALGSLGNLFGGSNEGEESKDGEDSGSDALQKLGGLFGGSSDDAKKEE